MQTAKPGPTIPLRKGDWNWHWTDIGPKIEHLQFSEFAKGLELGVRKVFRPHAENPHLLQVWGADEPQPKSGCTRPNL
jgi:hypothetical protein